MSTWKRTLNKVATIHIPCLWWRRSAPSTWTMTCSWTNHDKLSGLTWQVQYRCVNSTLMLQCLCHWKLITSHMYYEIKHLHMLLYLCCAVYVFIHACIYVCVCARVFIHKILDACVFVHACICVCVCTKSTHCYIFCTPVLNWYFSITYLV